jgi:hypothetical protein
MARHAFALLFAGCGTLNLPDAASQIFTHAVTCPTERVAIKARPDVAPTTVLPPPPMAPPPADVAADPERMKLWRHDHDTAPDFGRLHAAVFEATGCGHHVLYVCAHPRIDGNNSVWSASWDGNSATVFTDSIAMLPNTTAVDVDVLSSAVVCFPGAAP